MMNEKKMTRVDALKILRAAVLVLEWDPDAIQELTNEELARLRDAAFNEDLRRVLDEINPDNYLSLIE